MIVLDHGDDLLLITQSDHAHLAAEILSVCRFPDLLDNPRRRDLLRATREHDSGWQGLDAAPPVGGYGRPYSFTELPGDMRRDLWERAVGLHWPADPYVALLILDHSLEIHSDRAGDETWDGWLEERRGLRTRLLDEATIDSQALARDYPFLRFADLCSLAVCSGEGNAFELLGVTGLADGARLRLGPFPLAGATSFELACRRIPRRSYPNTVTLGSELAAARWETRTVQVAPLHD